jgi:phenylacetate-CoA ligase
MSALEGFYFGSPVFLQNLMISAYGALLYWRRLAGPNHARFLEEIRSWERLTPAEVSRRQGALLRKTIVRAARTTPHYRELFRKLHLDPENIGSREMLAVLPILEKAVVRSDPYRFLASDTHSSLSINTSGTTGSPLTIRCTREALQRNYAHFYRLREQLGIAPRDRCATFAGRTLVPPNADRPPFWRHNWMTRSLLFSTYHMRPEHMPDYVERLAGFDPLLIDSYPSALGLMAAYARERQGPPIRPRAIITSSETLLPSQRALAEAVFECHVTDQYGAAEMTAFVAQCSSGTYHVWPSYGICEILAGDRPARPGESGDLVCTGFINEAMPLVRYRTGDMAVAGEGCRCGLPYATIASIEGRRDDVIVTPDGRRVGRLDPVFKGVDDDAFREAQIVQEEIGRITLRYVKGSRYSELAVQKVKNELQKRLGAGMRIETEESEGLSRGSNGKVRSVISKLAEQETSSASGDTQ